MYKNITENRGLFDNPTKIIKNHPISSLRVGSQNASSRVICNIFCRRIFGCQDTPGLKSTREMRFSSRAEVVTKDTSASAAWREVAELFSLNMEATCHVPMHTWYIWKCMQQI